MSNFTLNEGLEILGSICIILADWVGTSNPHTQATLNPLPLLSSLRQNISEFAIGAKYTLDFLLQ